MPKRDWIDVADVIHGDAAARTPQYLPDRNIEISIAADLPLIRGDSVLLDQVLFNLLDNAVKYGGDATDQPLCASRRRRSRRSR